MRKKMLTSTSFILLLSILLVNTFKIQVFAQTTTKITTPAEFKYAIKPQFDKVYDFSEGLAKVRVDGKYGLIDKTGKIVCETKFNTIDNFSEGFAIVSVDGKYGFIDKTGKIVCEPQFDKLYDFSDGLAKVKISGKYGYVDKTGKIVCEPEFNLIYDLGEGLSIFGDKGILVDRTSNTDIKTNFNKTGNFSEGLAIVKVGSNYKFTTKTGKITDLVVKNEFGNMYNSNEGLNIDFSGKSDYFKEDLAKLCVNDKWGFIDKTGKIVCEPQFDEVNLFNEGIAKVKLNGKYGFIDKTGKIICKPQFDWADVFSEDVATVSVDGKYGFVDKTGKILIKPQFNVAGSFSEGLAMVYLGGKWGFIMNPLTK